MTDRHLAIQPGRTVATGYVPIHRIRLACRDRMAVGDVDRAYQRIIQLAPSQEWPPPNGQWEGEPHASGFVVHDGRHAVIAMTMLGFDSALVAWEETPQ